MPDFALHKQIEADSVLLRDLPLCQLRLQNIAVLPWLILVPRRPDLREIYELSQTDRAQAMEEIALTAKALTKLYAPDKINIGALGNMVPQLHIHVIARYKNDAAWPAPAWGKLTTELYTPTTMATIKAQLNADELWTQT